MKYQEIRHRTEDDVKSAIKHKKFRLPIHRGLVSNPPHIQFVAGNVTEQLTQTIINLKSGQIISDRRPATLSVVAKNMIFSPSKMPYKTARTDFAACCGCQSKEHSPETSGAFRDRRSRRYWIPTHLMYCFHLNRWPRQQWHSSRLLPV